MTLKYELIITEKPNAAKKIAEALADGKAIKKNNQGVPYYDITHGDKDIIVACAVGHLYTVDEDKSEKKKAGWTYPVFSVKWIPTADKGKASAFTRKYLSTIKKLAKGADSFTVATDFDIEGEVIGYNVLKYACNQKDGARMKFSTLTKDDLIESYEHKHPTLEWGQVNAGIVRHELDWYYGINLSRALTLAIKKAGNFKIMSIGRVQGPALKIVVDREKDIQAFKSEPYWQIQLLGSVNSSDIEAWHETDKFWKKEEAQEIFDKTKSKDATVKDVNKNEFKQNPPSPFDLTTLQMESFRALRISPKETLEIAQELYTSGAISYPRTSSQQLPENIGYAKILGALKNNDDYTALAEKLLAKKSLSPNNGKKTDPAHPAIYPTGLAFKGNEREFKVYDLIVKRFLATFAEQAVRETMTIKIDVENEIFIAKGTRTIEKGWHIFYEPYVSLEENELPKVEKGDNVEVKDIVMHDKETQPPKRYNPASIIRELEKRNLGTKSTRAQIVDTLVQRGYAAGQPLEATDFGIKTCNTLEKHSPDILDEELTRLFEGLMEEIREKKKKNEQVLNKAQEILTKLLKKFKKEEKQIGEDLMEAHRETQQQMTTIGKCQAQGCNGTLVMKRGKFGRFIACDKYPECKTTFKLPATGLIKPTEKECEECKYPVITVIRKRKKPQEVCINPDCPSKKSDDIAAQKEAEMVESGEEIKQCPKCKKGNLVLRKSVYGQFYGCSAYPKCKNTEQISNGNKTN